MEGTRLYNKVEHGNVIDTTMKCVAASDVLPKWNMAARAHVKILCSSRCPPLPLWSIYVPTYLIILQNPKQLPRLPIPKTTTVYHECCSICTVSLTSLVPAFVSLHCKDLTGYDTDVWHVRREKNVTYMADGCVKWYNIRQIKNVGSKIMSDIYWILILWNSESLKKHHMWYEKKRLKSI